MTELKTLKDFRKSHCEKIACGDGFVCEKCLKAEAVKWVKAWDKEIHTMDLGTSRNYGMRRRAFIDFFNITESDLSMVKRSCEN